MNSGFQYILWVILAVIIFPFRLFSQETGESETKFKLSGAMRFRGFDLSRNVLLSRQNPTYPIYNPIQEVSNRITSNTKAANQELIARSAGKQTTLSPVNESMNYFDSRILLNMEFYTSKYFDGLVGVQIGDVNFGGRPVSITDKNNPQTVGTNAGGELNQTTAVNVRTNFLYLNFKLKEYDFNARTGLQFFSSPNGRVMFSNGAGISMTKGISSFYRMTLEGGWIRARDRQFIDADSNSFNDKRYLDTNIFFAKAKFLPNPNNSVEFYSYYQGDNDQTDPYRETGDLFWFGVFDEMKFGTYSMTLHGVYNTGKTKSIRSYKDLNTNDLYQTRAVNFVSGGLWDLTFTYYYNNQINFNLISVGTTGRPGYDKDGTNAQYKSGGYRSLSPNFSVSNVAVDFTGGYTLFTSANMSGLMEYGAFANVIAIGSMQFTLGYYLLYATKPPKIEINREYGLFQGRETSPYLGQEYNFNIRWSMLSDFTLVFRSGYFMPGRGLRVLNDSPLGNYIRDVFISAEYKF